MSSESKSIDGLRIDRQVPGRGSFPFGLLALVLVLVCLLMGVAWWFYLPRQTVVRTVAVRQGSGGTSGTVLNASGYVTPRREATVSSKVTGKVLEVLIEEGMVVTNAQVLARLDDTNVRASLALAEAEWQATQSALAETRVRLDEAQKEWRRVSDLAANKIASPSELDRAEAEVKSLQARLQRQEVEVTVAERQVAVWRQQMEDLVIRAPFGGVVTSKDAQPGEMISPVSAGGGFTRTGICTIVDMESLEIEVDVNESFLNRVEPGRPVEATLDAYPDWKIPARVKAIIPTADRQKATVKVRVSLEQTDGRILPQMGVKVAFLGSGEAPAGPAGFVIPTAAVRRDGAWEGVWVVRGGRVERRALRLGATRQDQVVVEAGLTDGEKIVVSGPAMLAEGDRVKEEQP